MIRVALIAACAYMGYKTVKNKQKKLQNKKKIKALPPAKPMITLEETDE